MAHRRAGRQRTRTRAEQVGEQDKIFRLRCEPLERKTCTTMVEEVDEGRQGGIVRSCAPPSRAAAPPARACSDLPGPLAS
jgi:hypothetical protein